ncbi:MAG: holo-ACP synthase [Phycisphaerales bacterium JB040]
MAIVGHGVDLVEVARIERMLGEQGERFLQRCFTHGERAYADTSSKRRAEHLAARFAAKEAALKALGTGWSEGIGWTDIEVARDEAGCPSLVVTGRAGEIAARQGVLTWHVSLSHTETHAMASVIAES